MEGGGTSYGGDDGGSLRPMDAEQLRECGHRMVDFIADYYKSIERFPVLSQVQPGYLKELLPDSAPNRPDTLDTLFDDIREKIIPGVTHWQSPSYFAYYPSNSSTAGFLGEMLSAAFNIVGFSWITSPAATELEVIVLDWFAKMLKLPSQFLSDAPGGGVIQGTASEAVLVVLLAARDRTLKKHGKKSLEKLVVYASDQTHSALQKACQIAGIFPENFRVVKADCSKNYAVAPEAVTEAISVDLSSGLIPFFICATVGTTSSSAVDPLPELGNIAQGHDMWFHIDAAYAGSACICPEYRHHLDGVEKADSFNMNAHKWFLTNFDCSLLWVKDRSYLVEALSTYPEFLKNKASQANSVVDFKDWQIPLGRRFSACVASVAEKGGVAPEGGEEQRWEAYPPDMSMETAASRSWGPTAAASWRIEGDRGKGRERQRWREGSGAAAAERRAGSGGGGWKGGGWKGGGGGKDRERRRGGKGGGGGRKDRGW